MDSFKSKKTLQVDKDTYHYCDLNAAEKNGLLGIDRLPFSMKVLLENLLRSEDGSCVTKKDIEAVAEWLQDKGTAEKEISFRPARVLMQDFTGVPAVVDLAAMRDAMKTLNGDPKKINPLVPVDLVIDHSIIVDNAGSTHALADNVTLEYERNNERYRFLKWGQKAFRNFSVVPPGTGICHQINIEYLAKTVWTSQEIDSQLSQQAPVVWAYPDTVVGTDSHTTMVNGLSVLGWGVGGIEAEAAMLGQAQTMLLPEIIGFKLTGKIKEGVTTTDIVLSITNILRQKGVVGKFVEFFGPGLDHLSVPDRCTIANMAPEYGATCGFFPIDKATLDYLSLSGRDPACVKLVEHYAKTQGLFRSQDTKDPVFTDTISLDLSEVEPCLAGPKRPEDRVVLGSVKDNFNVAMTKDYKKLEPWSTRFQVPNCSFTLGHGDVVIAAITSCTNTSNPSVIIAAGLLARKAASLGLKIKPWVKSSLAPGSQVVAAYLAESGLQKDLDKLGFHLVGFGCTTCIGNSGPLMQDISQVIHDQELITAAVLSGNRNFEGRVSPDVQANYLASPPLVIAYALAGTVLVDLTKDPLGTDSQGNTVYLKDIWPKSKDIANLTSKFVTQTLFKKSYKEIYSGNRQWQAIKIPEGETYTWDHQSTYVRNPPYFQGMTLTPETLTDVSEARILALFGDKITTDHISPAGSIKLDSPAGKYLIDHHVQKDDFNQYGTRRGNHEVMMRGTFANIRILNHMLGAAAREGGFTIHYPSKETLPIYDAAMRYKKEAVPLVVIAGIEYGNGSSRDWAAKGTALLGVRAVIAQSFERIHRSNLVGMGVIPFAFEEGTSWKTLGLKGDELVTIKGLVHIQPRQKTSAKITFPDGKQKEIPILCRIVTMEELDYVKNSSILHYVLRRLAR